MSPSTNIAHQRLFLEVPCTIHFPAVVLFIPSYSIHIVPYHFQGLIDILEQFAFDVESCITSFDFTGDEASVDDFYFDEILAAGGAEGVMVTEAGFREGVFGVFFEADGAGFEGEALLLFEGERAFDALRTDYFELFVGVGFGEQEGLGD